MRRTIIMLRRSLSFVRGNVARAHRRQVPRGAGFALLVVIVTVSILGAVVSDFGYNARVDYEGASNARDQLRAEYLARSGINLARLLIKVQQSVIDKLNAQLKSDFQIAELAPFLLAAFGGGEDERQAMGDFLGVGTGAIKGLGLGKGASFDVAIGTEDGKININCGGGVPPMMMPGLPASQGAAPGLQGLNPQQALYSMLMSLMFSPRYNRMFETMTADGQYVTRDDVARAIIDWSDLDEARFDPAVPFGAGGGGSEDYRYDAQQDPYRAHNNYFDTVDELNLVRGVGDDYFGAFGSMFTAYGGCKVNLRAVTQQNWPITAAIVRTAATNPNDPALLDDVIVSALAQQVGMLIQLLPSQTGTVNDFLNLFKNGGNPPPQQPVPGQQPPPTVNPLFPGLPGIQLNAGKLNQIARTGAREVYRIEATGSVKRVGDKKIQVQIRAVFDTRHFNQNTTSVDPNDRMGTWVYWRME